ncbi:uracil-DNA glycosylase (plasmid) [Coraliomargarita sp. W4R53]
MPSRSSSRNGQNCSKLPTDWSDALAGVGWDAVRVEDLLNRVYAPQPSDIYPPRNDVFRALHATPINRVRAVVLGQDPYYDHPDKAHGLAFSVRTGIAVPRSLRMVFRALEGDFPGLIDPERHHGDLTRWATQGGVLLLNAALTVERNRPESHITYWTPFIDSVLSVLRNSAQPIAFLLWGEKAIRRGLSAGVDTAPHEVFEAAHPRPGAKLHGRAFSEAHTFVRSQRFLSRGPSGPADWSLT